MLFGNTWSRVHHANSEMTIHGFCRHPNLTRIGELDGVAHEVEEHLGGRLRQDYLAEQASAKAKADAASATSTADAARLNKETEDAKLLAAKRAQEKKDADAKAFGEFETQYRAEHPISGFAKEHPLVTALGVGVPSFALGLFGKEPLPINSNKP
jgi:hypothetical protein